MPDFFLGPGNLNSGPHAFSASPLLPESPLQPHRCLLRDIPSVGILLGTVGTRVTDRNTASTETIEQGDRGQACFPCCRIAAC